MDKEYKILKPITAAAIYSAGDKVNPCFQEEFQKFLRWAYTIYPCHFHFFYAVSFPYLQETFKDHPSWKTFFIEKGFIKETSQITYKVGDKFECINYSINTSENYMLAVVGSTRKVLLIRENGHYFWGEPPIEVNDLDKITEEEFELITRGKSKAFIKIERKDPLWHLSNITNLKP